MKKVRFESPVKVFKLTMQDSENHSPRPFVERQIQAAPQINFSADYNYISRTVPYTNDPLQRFECSNSSPYPGVAKTRLTNINTLDSHCALPSNDLDLSILDSSHYGPTSVSCRPSFGTNKESTKHLQSNTNISPLQQKMPARVFTPLENKVIPKIPPNILSKSDDFFLRRENINDIKQLQSQMNNLQLDKENNPFLKKTEIMKLGQVNVQTSVPQHCAHPDVTTATDILCQCHHCVQILHTKPHSKHSYINNRHPGIHKIEKCQEINSNNCNVICPCVNPKVINHPTSYCPCHQPVTNFHPGCNCNNHASTAPKNAVDKKSWTIQKYEQSQAECLDIETQSNITQENREPTVADLFKIIKMQNEQLQLLQEKVDKFISSKEATHIPKPVQNYVSECIEIGTDEKISIGVMTSFEMVRTSTVINKEIVTQSEAQIQCNRSQISIKEVVSKHPANVNFLDGITPIRKNQGGQRNGELNDCTNLENFHEDKTLNEMSLYNVQVDNAITPQLSPEQSLYLDIRDYSDSDASSDDQSNVGWTYYNKVMTRVNGILQDSDMPSSASALYRNARQKCMQMQIDKTNISVAKRVTFGDDPLAPQQHMVNPPSTDTSLKMNQLAAKYLKHAPVATTSPRPTAGPADMSLATRNYMEKHKIILGTQGHAHMQMELPKFLDITALKQQPKLL